MIGQKLLPNDIDVKKKLAIVKKNIKKKEKRAQNKIRDIEKVKFKPRKLALRSGLLWDDLSLAFQKFLCEKYSTKTREREGEDNLVELLRDDLFPVMERVSFNSRSTLI